MTGPFDTFSKRGSALYETVSRGGEHYMKPENDVPYHICSVSIARSLIRALSARQDRRVQLVQDWQFDFGARRFRRGTMGKMYISLGSLSHVFRYVSEIDPVGKGKTKGGYLEGLNSLPRVSCGLKLFISTVPLSAPEHFFFCVWVSRPPAKAN